MLNELIKKAEEIKKKETNSLFEVKIDRFEKMGIKGNIKLKRPDSSILASFVERNHDSAYLLGECIVEPSMADEKLLKAYKANSKKQLVEKIFTKEEITDVDNIIARLVTENRSVSLVEKLADDIKN